MVAFPMYSFDLTHLKDNHCFLCSTPLSKTNRTDEHIFPKWLQIRSDLWDKSITLLNHTTIPYRLLKIPCCTECNNEYLSKLELQVSDAFKSGCDAVRKLDPLCLFQWCSKLLYGMLHKEMSLLFDQREVEMGTIVEPEFMENLTTFHHFMTSIRRPFKFFSFTPYSLFVVETHDYGQTGRNFDYLDLLEFGSSLETLRGTLVLGIRSADVGIICVFQDNGAQKQELQDIYDKYEGTPLQPKQFSEVFVIPVLPNITLYSVCGKD